MIWPFIEWFPAPAQGEEPPPPKQKPGKLQAPGFLRVAEAYSLDLEPFKTTGERDAILASSGMGKSYLTGVLMEETLESGGLVVVIDPEGEHHTLAQRYPMLVIGGEKGSLPLENDRVAQYVETILGKGVSAVFDLSEMNDPDQRQAYTLIANTLFEAQQDHRRKIRLVVEEAQIYAPQSGITDKEALAVSQNIAKRGRKRALDSLWATQRPASISKDILSQCNRFWFGGVQSENDIKAIKPHLDLAGISSDQVRALTKGQFYLYANGETRLIQVRKRYCKHAGSTPQADTSKPVARKEDLKRIVEGLR